MTVKKEIRSTEEIIKDTLSSLNCLIEAHRGYAEFCETDDKKAVIFCGGQCAGCDDKCIEDAIKERLPGIEIIFR